MNGEQLIRAWKDEDYRRSLSEGELSALPENPAGIVQLSDLEMEDVRGNPRPWFSVPQPKRP